MKSLQIDPRIQFLILMATALLTMMSTGEKSLFLSLLIVIYLYLQGYYHKANKFLVVGSIIYCINYVIERSDNQILSLFGFLTFFMLRFLPVSMMASSLQQVSTGKLMLALQQLQLPKPLIITVSVAMRFIPVIKQENEAIQASAKLRGVSLSQPKNWGRFLTCFEYSIIPLMMRTLKIADELAAAAATKGIDYPHPRSSIYQLRLQWYDVVAVLLYLVWAWVVIMVRW